MIKFPGAIWMAPEPADMRKGIDRLSQQVRGGFGHNPCEGDVFLFRNRAGNRIKFYYGMALAFGFAREGCIVTLEFLHCRGITCSNRWLRLLWPEIIDWL